MIKTYICPVCAFDGLKERPFGANQEPSHEICPKCGFEFGFDGGNDPELFKKYYEDWVNKGAKWFMPKLKEK